MLLAFWMSQTKFTFCQVGRRLSILTRLKLHLLFRNIESSECRTFGISSSYLPKISAKFQRGHPQRGRHIKVGMLKRRFWTNVQTGYLTNRAKQGHSYYGTPIGTRRCSYRLVLFSVTLSDANYPQTTPFSTFCIVFNIFVVSGDRDFKFGRQIVGSNIASPWW